MKHAHILFQVLAGITICLSISVQTVSAKNHTDKPETPKVSINADSNEIVINHAMINKFNNYDGEVVVLKDIILNNDFVQAKLYLSAYNNLDLSNDSDEIIMQALTEKAEKINLELKSESYFITRQQVLTQK